MRKNPSYRDAPSSAPRMHNPIVCRRRARGSSGRLVNASTAAAANQIVNRRWRMCSIPISTIPVMGKATTIPSKVVARRKGGAPKRVR